MGGTFCSDELDTKHHHENLKSGVRYFKGARSKDELWVHFDHHFSYSI